MAVSLIQRLKPAMDAFIALKQRKRVPMSHLNGFMLSEHIFEASPGGQYFNFQSHLVRSVSRSRRCHKQI